MSYFFALPNKVLMGIYNNLTPKELLRLWESGESRLSKSDEVITALFMQRDAAKSYQQKIIQSWLEGHTTYPLAVARDNPQVFLEALQGLDLPYKIAGLHVISSEKTASDASIDHLLTRQINDICQGRESNKKMLGLFVSQLKEEQISKLLAWIEDIGINWYRKDPSELENALQILIVLAPRLNTTQITKNLFYFIQFNLKSNNFDVCRSAHEALIALEPKLNEAHITSELVRSILINLNCTHAGMARCAQQTLIALAPRLEEAHIQMLLQRIKNGFVDSDKAERIFAQQAFTALEPVLDKEHVNKFFAWVERNMGHENYNVRSSIQTVLAARVSILDEANINPNLIAWIEEDLRHIDFNVRRNALKALTALAPKLKDRNTISKLLVGIKDHMFYRDVAINASEALIALVPVLDEVLLNELWKWTMNGRTHSNDENRRVARFGLIALRPQLSHDQISELLALIEVQLANHNPLLRSSALHELIALAPTLDEEYITPTLLDLIEENLSHNSIDVMINALNALVALVPRKNEIELSTTLLTRIRDRLLESDSMLRFEAQQALAALAPKLSGTQISNIFAWVESRDFLDAARLQRAIIAVVPNLHEIPNIPQLLGWIKEGLCDVDENYCLEAQRAFIALEPTQQHITPILFYKIVSDLSHKNDQIRNNAEQILAALAPKLDETYINMFLAEIQNPMGRYLQPFPSLGKFLSVFCSPTNPCALSIAKQLRNIIRGPVQNESDMALNALAEWGMSWVVKGRENNCQDIDSSKKLIDSISVTNLQRGNPSPTINVTLIDALQDQWAAMLQQTSLALNP
ncbi:hypothetical protein ACD661_01145 [Legionella lytica]|uniref:HEAT repeat protein n=1 Tax=Legionella lytica TaxID=96232 RepID=A0ABW8D382_9GAMM